MQHRVDVIRAATPRVATADQTASAANRCRTNFAPRDTEPGKLLALREMPSQPRAGMSIGNTLDLIAPTVVVPAVGDAPRDESKVAQAPEPLDGKVMTTDATEVSRAALEEVAGTSDVLDVPHVARLLGVGRNTIYTLVAKNQIPHRRLGKAIRFSRAAVMSWLASWSSRDAKERQ